MAHTVPYTLLFPTHLVDALDAAWLQEELPDDDVPLPDGVDPPVDEPDDALREAGGEACGEDERWPELALGELT